MARRALLPGTLRCVRAGRYHVDRRITLRGREVPEDPRKELRVLAYLGQEGGHDNVVKLEAYGATAETLYVVMPFYNRMWCGG